MTKAIVTPAVPAVTRVIVERPEVPEQVTLVMDRKTAEVLMLITCVIGGKPAGLRGCVASIRDALRSAGVTEFGRRPDEMLIDATARCMVRGSGITFKD